MLRILAYLPLLGIAPVVCFLGDYLGGAGALPEGVGFLASAIGMFILPWAVAGVFLVVPRTRVVIRVLLCVGALAVQGIVLFTAVPPGATCEMMGLAHRLRREFSAQELRGCAAHIRQRFAEGTLKTTPRGKDDPFMVAQDALVVSDTELPASLRGRFQRVFIQRAPATGEQQVVFALGRTQGIICDNRKNVRGFFVYSMADGVEAYRYQRL